MANGREIAVAAVADEIETPCGQAALLEAQAKCSHQLADERLIVGSALIGRQGLPYLDQIGGTARIDLQPERLVEPSPEFGSEAESERRARLFTCTVVSFCASESSSPASC